MQTLAAELEVRRERRLSYQPISAGTVPLGASERNRSRGLRWTVWATMRTRRHRGRFDQIAPAGQRDDAGQCRLALTELTRCCSRGMSHAGAAG